MTLFDIAVLKEKVVTTSEVVKFTYIDPYGHLNSARLAEIIINHRIEGVERNMGCSTIEIVKSLNVAFYLANFHINFLKCRSCDLI